MNSKNYATDSITKPNILFLIFDSLRSDKVSGSGNNSITPTIDFIKENGVLFNNTISSSDGTILSYAGLFSGKHPFKTGMRSAKLTRLCETTSYLEILKTMDIIFMVVYPNLLPHLKLYQNLKITSSHL